MLNIIFKANMLVLTEQFDVTDYVPDYKYAIGVWRDSHQKQSYFYCVSNRSHYRPPYSQIFRLKLDDPALDSCWEYVGKVDFFLKMLL